MRNKHFFPCKCLYKRLWAQLELKLLLSPTDRKSPEKVCKVLFWGAFNVPFWQQQFVLNKKIENTSTENDKPCKEGTQKPLRRLNELLLWFNLKTLPPILSTDKGSPGKLNHHSDYHLSSTPQLFSAAVHKTSNWEILWLLALLAWELLYSKAPTQPHS